MVLPGKAQYYYYDNRYLDNDIVTEIGGSIGAMNAVTDIGNKAWSPAGLKMSGGLYGGVMYRNFVGARFEINWGRLEAWDSSYGKGSGNYDRNLNFRTNITELSVIGEFHPLIFARLYTQNSMPVVSPYVLAGYTFFNYNPMAVFRGQTIPLQPLRTEGQGFDNVKATLEPYNLNQSAIPVGMGVRYELHPRVNIRGEFMYRILFTDYLDDLSGTYIDPNLFDANLSPANAQLARILNDRRGELNPLAVPTPGAMRGNAGKKDAYWGLSLKVGIVLGRGTYN